MRFINRKLALAAGTAVASVGLFGAVAFAAFAPDASTTANALFGPSNAVAAEDTKHDKLKDLLDGVVKRTRSSRRSRMRPARTKSAKPLSATSLVRLRSTSAYPTRT